MKNIKRLLILVLVLVLTISASIMPIEAAGKTIVEQRLEQIEKLYPQDSTFDHWVRSGYIEYGGCGGLVAFATRKIFHNSYYDGSPDYKKVGSASTTSTSAMQNLFKKAKVGDVICWSRNGYEAHLALFMSYSSSGIYIYEANFTGPNQVWYNHFWPWSGMDDWPSGGATTVEVYRSKNYEKVNKGTAAQKVKVGQIIEYNYEYDNIYLDEYSKTYTKFKILDNSINNPLAVVLEHSFESNKGDTEGPAKSFIYYGKDSDYGDQISICGEFGINSYFVDCDQYFKVVTPEELAPKKVKNVTAKNSAKGKMKITWKQTKNTTGYQIFRSTEKNGTYTKIKKIKGAAKTTFTDKNLKKGTTYYYKVRAYKTIAKTAFNGKFSAVASKKVKK